MSSSARARLRPWHLGALAALLVFSPARGADLDKLTDVRWVDTPANDGDSFIVQAGDRQLHLRLYYVDCPETRVTTDGDAKRVREQAGYFGLTNVVQVVGFGEEAGRFTARALARPFTVYTAYADALGRTPHSRVYAFVVTAEGRDLASELVAHGYARVYGTAHALPDGTSSDEMWKRLHDLETRAILERAGAWKLSDPDQIVRLRAAERDERKDLKEIEHQVAQSQRPTGLVDLNTASSQEIQSLPGIGPVLAARILEARPYRAVDDLLRVNGIGPELFEKLRPRLAVSPAANPTPSAN